MVVEEIDEVSNRFNFDTINKNVIKIDFILKLKVLFNEVK
jgi:hypothetical protein